MVHKFSLFTQIRLITAGRMRFPAGWARLAVNAHASAVLRSTATRKNRVSAYAAHVAIECANERYSSSIDAIANSFGAAMLHVIHVQYMPTSIIVNE